MSIIAILTCLLTSACGGGGAAVGEPESETPAFIAGVALSTVEEPGVPQAVDTAAAPVFVNSVLAQDMYQPASVTVPATSTTLVMAGSPAVTAAPPPSTDSTTTSTTVGTAAQVAEAPVYAEPRFQVLRTLYVDGSQGNDNSDGTSSSRAVRTLSSRLALNNTKLLLRRGTTIELRGSLYPNNLLVDAYGDGAKPIVKVASSEVVGIVPTTGEILVRNVVFVGNPQRMDVGSAIGGGAASRVVVEDCEFSFFANAIQFAGKDGVIRRNKISNVSNTGIFGGKSGYPAPSGYLISKNTIDATGAGNDAITLHDGDGVGEGNSIIENDLWGARENSIDVLGQYRGTIIRGNRIGRSGLSGVIVSRMSGTEIGGEGTVISDNIFTGSSYTAIYSRVNGATIARNRISNVVAGSMATAIAVSGRADILDNVISVPAGTMRPVIAILEASQALASPTGSIQRNIIENRSIQRVYGASVAGRTLEAVLAGWIIDGNSYRLPDTTSEWFFGMGFDEWRGRMWSVEPRRMDALSTLTLVPAN